MNAWSTLGSITETIMGQAPPGTECNKKGIGTPFVKAGEFSSNGPIIREWTTKPLKFAKKDDVLLCVVGATSGKINRGEDCSIGRSVAAIRAKEDKLNHNYLYFFMSSWSSRLLKMSQGAAQTVITKNMISELQIPLPPLETQKKITAILDLANELQQKTKALIDKYDELTQSLFLDIFGEPVTNPKGWEKVKFNSLCSFDKISIKPEDIVEGTFYIGLESIEKETGQILDKVTVKSNELKSNKFWFDSNYILYGKLRPYLNKVALPYFEGVCSTDIIPLKPISDKTNKAFIVSIMRNRSFVAFANERSRGANLPRISPKEIEKYMVVNPPIQLQNQFAERVQAIEVQKAQTQQSLQKAEELFNSLLQKAFKGELVK